MKRGRRICNQLKAVRRQIAEENGIDLQQPECTHTGDCRGTCPRCEAEVRYLEQALTQRLSLGKAATVAGLTLSLAACGGSNKPSLQTEKPLDTLMSTATDVPTVPDTNGTDPLSDDSLVVTGFEGETFMVPGEMDIIDTDDSTNHIDSSSLKLPKEEWFEGEVSDELITPIEEEPSFPGGTEAMYRYLEQNIQMPNNDSEVSGTVVVRFIVESDGSITDVRLLRDIGGGYGKEAVRVVKSMPRWIPGKVQGKAVRSEFMLPIVFALH